MTLYSGPAGGLAYTFLLWSLDSKIHFFFYLEGLDSLEMFQTLLWSKTIASISGIENL